MGPMFSDVSPVMSKVFAYVVDDMDPFSRMAFITQLEELVDYNDITGKPVLDHVEDIPHSFRLQYDIDSNFERLERYIRKEQSDA
ncbi:hypothetical protein PP304_gp067 [Gordonia phage Phendrix]|uniref:Uncharacterized protein n=2 Tax=Godonkavirus TaxID=2733178 RepID=A0A4D6E239_9CAUD|nr:hypothetical protein HOV33_gp068 [Gordonia phage GodonK]YP_010649111.1 hypothetical protein PP304_gp067 [Gordonia phage Phendrix]QBZ72687.1 hypothetical protein SEA_GODONK_68 [Gordonia phage GodonK]QDK02615.1 hypothetical protein SEA_PHENDRIX_67 [Gordonia phage Phendrix]